MISPNLLKQLLKGYKKDQVTITVYYRIQTKPKDRQYPGKSENKLNSQQQTMLVYVPERYIKSP